MRRKRTGVVFVDAQRPSPMRMTLTVRPSGVDVDHPFVFGNAQVQALRRLRGRQPFKDQRGVGKRLASGGGAGVGEVAGGEVGA